MTKKKKRNPAKIFVDPTIFSMNKFPHFQPKSVTFWKINSLEVFFYSSPCKVKTTSTATTATKNKNKIIN